MNEVSPPPATASNPFSPNLCAAKKIHISAGSERPFPPSSGCLKNFFVFSRTEEEKASEA